MSYTVGVKRRILPGYRTVTVNGHDWQNGRFILNLTDGSQEHIPGFQAPAVKVYADFWGHLAQLDRRPAPVAPVAVQAPVQAAAPAPRQGAVSATIPLEPEYSEPLPPQESPEMTEVRRRAAERVRSILDGQH